MNVRLAAIICWLSYVVFHFAGRQENCYSLIEVCDYYTEQTRRIYTSKKWTFLLAFGVAVGVDIVFFLKKLLLIHREVLTLH